MNRRNMLREADDSEMYINPNRGQDTPFGREPRPRPQNKIDADTIFGYVLDEIGTFKATSQLDVPLYGTPQELLSTCHIKAYCKDERTITVEYNNDKIDVPCDLSASDDTVARCVMCGFARIYLKKKDLPTFYKESKQRRLQESFEINPNYSHFAFDKNRKVIVNAWEYGDISGEDLRRNKKYYFWDDMVDNEFDPRDFVYVTAAYLRRLGIDPYDSKNWSNR